MVKRRIKRKPKLTPEQERNAQIFRLRGFYANSKTLPFTSMEILEILEIVDNALTRLGAQTQTDYMGKDR